MASERTDDDWLHRQLRAFVRWSVFWFVSLFLSAVFFRVAMALSWRSDLLSLGRPFIDLFVVIGLSVTLLAVVVLLVVSRLRDQ